MSDPVRYDVPPIKDVVPQPGVYPFGLNEPFRKALNKAPGLLSYSRLTRFADPDKKISPYVAGVGNLVGDALLFGWDAILGHYAFAPTQWMKNEREGKRLFNEFAATHPGQTVIRPKEHAEANRLIDIALANPEFVAMLNAEGHCEAGVVADVDGLRFRSWLDKLTPRTVIDLKTSRAGSPEEFLDGMIKYKYDVQAALYLDQCEAIGLGQLQFFWAVISKTTNRAWMQELPPWAYHTGRRWRADMVKAYHREQAFKTQVADLANTGENG